MRIKLTIMGIVAVCTLACVAAFVMTTLFFGVVVAATVALVILTVATTVYVQLVRPWHSQWGATDGEVTRSMPGDELVENAASTTRAVTIGAPADYVWPWLVQMGYGRAGWYSYDWIDNDGKPSADRIVPRFQDLRVGDRIEMVPGDGPEVAAMKRQRWLLAGDGQGGTWCLALYPIDDYHTRLVSRWRQAWDTSTLMVKFWVLNADPGAFIMEQKMLRGIKTRAEAAFMRALAPAGRSHQGVVTGE